MPHSNFKPGEEITITDNVYFESSTGLAELVTLAPEELEEMKKASIRQEEAIYVRLCASTNVWAEQAVKTRLLTRAIEYLKTPAVRHTSNVWKLDEYNNHEISNMVYKMNWRMYESTRWDETAQKSITAYWELSWHVHFNTPGNADRFGYARIAGQERKHFDDKTAMEKYLQGRIAAYADLFTELSPPIPADQRMRFSVNGLLLPGYTVKEPIQPDKEAVDDLLSFLEEERLDADPLTDPELPTESPLLFPAKPPKKPSREKPKKSGPTR